MILNCRSLQFNIQIITIYEFNSQSQKEPQPKIILANSQEAIANDNCLIRRVKCGHKGPIGYDRNPCNHQVQSLLSPPPYHHHHHNGKRQNQKLRPLKVTILFLVISIAHILHFVMKWLIY